jgi:hypothetical protein
MASSLEELGMPLFALIDVYSSGDVFNVWFEDPEGHAWLRVLTWNGGGRGACSPGYRVWGIIAPRECVARVEIYILRVDANAEY